MDIKLQRSAVTASSQISKHDNGNRDFIEVVNQLNPSPEASQKSKKDQTLSKRGGAAGPPTSTTSEALRSMKSKKEKPEKPQLTMQEKRRI